ncbi:hypothetical protein [Cupriavidus campinensis]
MMKLIVTSFSLAILTLYASGIHSETLCKSTERIAFNCQLRNGISSLCEVNDGGAFIYRNGTSDNIRLEVSSPPSGRTSFRISSTPYAGGSETHISFSRYRHVYFLYDKIVKTDDGPESSAGVTVFNAGRKVVDQTCLNDASIHSIAYDALPWEEYRDIWQVEKR